MRLRSHCLHSFHRLLSFSSSVCLLKALLSTETSPVSTMEELDAGGSTEGGTTWTWKLQERLHLLAKIAGRRAEDRRVTYLDRHPEVDKFHHDRDFAQCLDRIRTVGCVDEELSLTTVQKLICNFISFFQDDIRCSAPSCRCKIPSRHAEGWRVRPSKPVREILSHQRHNVRN